MADEDGAIPTALNPVTVHAKFSPTSDVPSGANSRQSRRGRCPRSHGGCCFVEMRRKTGYMLGWRKGGDTSCCAWGRNDKQEEKQKRERVGGRTVRGHIPTKDENGGPTGGALDYRIN
ncbi:hypothetical protein ALC62_01574 [Cyphomyrmex costatus]|uniref:Uncharacterized protein n=1 Tax=Cyphomyrmex costatus TaxID=456900 RepID=A0A195D399_9HYME|nr:hypothetical protein ALC62_01574 [Cyphomyrmex costatus]